MLADSVPIDMRKIGCTITGLVQDANNDWTRQAAYYNLAEDPNFRYELLLSEPCLRRVSQRQYCIDAGSISAHCRGLRLHTRIDGAYSI